MKARAALGGAAPPSCYGRLRARLDTRTSRLELKRRRYVSEPRDEGALSTVRKKLHKTKDVEAKKKLVRGGRKGLEGWGGRLGGGAGLLRAGVRARGPG